ncbi:hypothetical protein FDECE_2201 [Fusarium decemcellulare]|nr:hypothetical protein FDECE_2201 [Fusarium decemcellulare]
MRQILRVWFTLVSRSVEDLISILEENNVDTVISALGGLAPPEAEKALIHAAEASSVTRRFIPSVSGIKYRREYGLAPSRYEGSCLTVTSQAWFPAAQAELAAMTELEGTSLERTIVCNGFFLDYWRMPKAKSYLRPRNLY